MGEMDAPAGTTPYKRRIPDKKSGIILDLFPAERSASTSRFLSAMGGFSEDRALSEPKEFFAAVGDAMENTLKAADEDRVHKVQPPPSDIWSMMRLIEPILRINGDIWNTILIPAQILFKNDIRIGCKDKKAREEWERFYTEIVPINEWSEESFYTVEKFGQFFPLEAWDKDPASTTGQNDLKGIVTLPPLSVWVGYHLGLDSSDMEIMSPTGQFSEAMLKVMEHDAIFNSFSVNLNEQTKTAYRVGIKPGYMSPVYGQGKLKYERYAIPHIARAFKNIMYRMILSEYRQNIIESFIQQILMFIVGSNVEGKDPPKGAVSKVLSDVNTVAKNHKGELVFGWPVEVKNIKPETLDNALTTEAFPDATQAIFNDLGFSLFLSTGMVPGSGGRGGSAQVGIDVQLALERWESHHVGTFRWARDLGLKWAKMNNPALVKHPPTFSPGSIDNKTQQSIEKRIKPLATMGLLSYQTALKDSGYDYAQELSNKEEEKNNRDLFSPQPTFAQTSSPFGGGQSKTTFEQTPGRPRGSPDGENSERASIALSGESPIDDNLADTINTYFDQMLVNPNRDAINAFFASTEQQLRLAMAKSYEKGWLHYGGSGDLDTAYLNNRVQGLPFHVSKLKAFKKDLLGSTGKPEDLIGSRYRAQQYASATHTAYVLGTQAAMKQKGATAWQRILHPELTQTGPCQDCIADAQMIHKIQEPFWEPHPSGACGIQSVMFHFGDRAPIRVEIPGFIAGARELIQRLMAR